MMKICLMVLILFAGCLLRAQVFHATYHHQDSLYIQEDGFSFHVLANNFLRNNEYFNPYTEGMTYFGTTFQPELSYTLSSGLSLSAGWYSRYYYGSESFNASLPVYRIRYSPTPSVHLIFGQLYGQLDHDLIEPIYSTDNYFLRKPEYGLQVIADKKLWKTDIWLSWDRFILKGDPSQEEITGGMNVNVELLKWANKHKLQLAIHGIVHHFGGQVDNSSRPLETRMNIAPGLEYDGSLLKEKELKFMLAGFLIQASDHSSVVTIPYKKGWASYAYGMIGYHWIKMAIAHLHGEYFFSPLGEPLFSSVSGIEDWYYTDTRELLSAKVSLEPPVHPKVHMGILFESYYDTRLGNLDFSYGLNLKINTSWSLFSAKK